MKHFKLLQNNQNGFTLMEMLIAVAIGGASMAVIASGLSMSNNFRSVANSKTEVSLLSDRIATIMSKGETCKNALASTTYTGAPLPNVSIDGVAEGSNLAGNVRVKMMKVDPSGATPTNYINGKKLWTAYLKYQAETSVSGGNKIDTKVRTMPLKILTGSANEILECKLEFSAEDRCNLQGRLWDAAASTPDGLRCKPADFCQYAGSFSQAAQGGFINRVTGDYSCPAGFSAQRSGTVAYAYVSGKGKAATSGNAVMSCVRCGPPLQNQGVNNAPVIDESAFALGEQTYNEAVGTQEDQITKMKTVREDGL